MTTPPTAPARIDPAAPETLADAPISVPDAPSHVDVRLTMAELRKRGVTADEIIRAFRVKADAQQNQKWWTERFTNPTRYKKILSARLQKGQASRGGQHFPSWWDPFLIASWLITERHMPRDRVVRVLQQSFPDFAVNDHLL